MWIYWKHAEFSDYGAGELAENLPTFFIRIITFDSFNYVFMKFKQNSCKTGMKSEHFSFPESNRKDTVICSGRDFVCYKSNCISNVIFIGKIDRDSIN